ncbi:alpha/beta fold hydrolase [Nocardia sp. SYP-A9097]|uniref:alpha/beta fold hydrolase n=1 Tax=Nocardia sp. SYP-A9097 TaxID=2663237 RepID=UPI00129A99CD|nr:alpha/beta hydrolase [Nocardia sp. SYP-A9097]MRH88022.1 alpha/beta fold hydrolase [Nocardia sp. SYP-A9097]
MPLDTQRSPEHLVTVGDADLCVTTFGDRRQPPVLLPCTSRLFWEDRFCDRLAGAGRFVLRYDIRDTGRSTAYAPGSPGYRLRDLVSDIIGLMDVFELPRAHLVGFSVAGWICQLAALDHPDRVSALTLISTRPTSPGPADSDLPDHSDRVMEFFTKASTPDWSDRAAVIDYGVELDRIRAGTHGFDEQQARQQTARMVDRTTNMASSMRNLAFAEAGDRWRERLGEITAPTLVVHGTDDPFFPYGNGRAMAREIPGADLLPLNGIGHELPATTWDQLLAAMLVLQPESVIDEGAGRAGDRH